ncbi:protein kinase domain-containing protein [Planobispora rosea]|uniref:protein kinase domain-containing protein n=1 Tax=Planobispora rosea TaxID=35762 RepID=UPI00083A4C59|nr:protein kinase [Planobispora rosea]
MAAGPIGDDLPRSGAGHPDAGGVGRAGPSTAVAGGTSLNVAVADGTSLRAAVAGGRVITGDGLLRLGTAIAAALAVVHDAGVAHRGVKPDNVLLGPDGPRLVGLGTARTMETAGTTVTGPVTGVRTSMPPEVFTGQRAGTAADVFGWGCVMVFAATGEDPFHAESLGCLMHRVLSVDPDLSAIPAPLHDLVAAALAKQPHARPTARHLLAALTGGGSRRPSGG